MVRFGRRSFVLGAALLPPVLLTQRAEATLMRGLPLRSMIAQSEHVVLLTALESRCLSIPIGGRPALITETRLRVEDAFAQRVPKSSELLVRTLGGVLDGVGELVHGQAEFARAVRCLAFLTRGPDDSLWVTGMAQGHFPVSEATGAPLLAASPHLPTLRDFEHSAVRTLVGQNLLNARHLVEENAR